MSSPLVATDLQYASTGMREGICPSFQITWWNPIFAAIRGDLEKPGSNFDYAVPPTETVLLGTIAIRSGKKVEYDSASMTFKDNSLNGYITEPVRRGWEYGEDLAG